MGCCGQWTKGRDTEGDTALANALIQYGGIKRERLVHLGVGGDHETSKTAVVESLLTLLAKTSKNESLFLYYGGHGSLGVACTQV